MITCQAYPIESWPEGPLVAFGSRYALPSRFSARLLPWQDGQPICEVTLCVEAGTVRCESLRLVPVPGVRLDAAALRSVPMVELVRRATDHTMRRLKPVADIAPDLLEWWLAGDAEMFSEGVVAVPSVMGTQEPEYQDVQKARRNGVDHDTIVREAADVYRLAFNRGQRPTKAVEEHFGVSRSVASRWVKEAREAGHLGPATPRRASA